MTEPYCLLCIETAGDRRRYDLGMAHPECVAILQKEPRAATLKRYFAGPPLDTWRDVPPRYLPVEDYMLNEAAWLRMNGHSGKQ